MILLALYLIGMIFVGVATHAARLEQSYWVLPIWPLAVVFVLTMWGLISLSEILEPSDEDD